MLGSLGSATFQAFSLSITGMLQIRVSSSSFLLLFFFFSSVPSLEARPDTLLPSLWRDHSPD